MANLVAGRDVSPELVQGAVSGASIARAMSPLMGDTPERDRALEGLAHVRKALGAPGAAKPHSYSISVYEIGGGFHSQTSQNRTGRGRFERDRSTAGTPYPI